MSYQILRTIDNPGSASWADAASTVFLGSQLVTPINLNSMESVELVTTFFASLSTSASVMTGWAPQSALPANVRLMVTARVSSVNEVTFTVFNAGTGNMGGPITILFSASVLNIQI